MHVNIDIQIGIHKQVVQERKKTSSGMLLF